MIKATHKELSLKPRNTRAEHRTSITAKTNQNKRRTMRLKQIRMITEAARKARRRLRRTGNQSNNIATPPKEALAQGV